MKLHHVVLLCACLLAPAPALAEDAAGRYANEKAVIGALKTISTAQSLFREGDKDQNGTLDYAGSLAALGKVKLISKQLASGTYRGYTIKITRGKDAPEFLWMATASPTKPGVTGDRHFVISHEGVTYHALKPFSHNGECKVSGVPTSDALKGWKPTFTGLAKIMHAAKQGGALTSKRFPRRLFFLVEGKKVATRVVVGGVRWSRYGGGEVGEFRVDGKGRVIGTETRVTELARFRKATISIGAIASRRPDTIVFLNVRDGKLRIQEKRAGAIRPDRPYQEVAWRKDAITLSMALYVFPSLYDHWGKTKLSFPVIVTTIPKAELGTKLTGGARPQVKIPKGELVLEKAGDFVNRKGGTAAEQAITLKHPELGTAYVWVSTAKANQGRILEIRGFQGELLTPTTSKKAREIFMATMPKKARKNLEQARKYGNEAAAMGALRTISTAQTLYREADKDGNGELDYAPDLAALGKTNLIDKILASGKKNGYRFKLTRSKKAPEFMWMASASPLEPGKTGDRHFAINHEGVTYQSLKPFKHAEDCKLSGGVPVGKELKGYKRPGAELKKGESSESGAINTLRTISSCQSLFREGDKDGDSVLDYANSLKELHAAKLIDDTLAKGTKYGYRFKVCHGSTAPEFIWMATASPVQKGKRHFAMNHEGVIFYSDKPIPLDTKDCKLPKGLKPVGK